MLAALFVSAATERPQDAEQPTTQAASSAATRPVRATSQSALFEAGCQELSAGHAAAAVRLLARAAAKYPARIDYALKLAEAYTANEQPEAARRLLENLGALYPQNVAVRIALARNHADQYAWQRVLDTLVPLEARLHTAGVLLLAEACRRTGDDTRATATLRRGLSRFPTDEQLWLALIDEALGQQAHALAQQRIAAAMRRVGPSPQLHFRAAQACFQLDRVLGATEIREVPGGRTGQFCGGWLLAERREGRHRFLCCPQDSALYQLRRALDAGLDEPAAHVLHALIWQRAGRPAVGFAILKSREALLLETAEPSTLAAFARLALDAGALGDFLRYARLRADRQPEQREAIMLEAYLAVAERYNERGDSVCYAAFLRRALQLQPDNTELTVRLADADWAAKRYRPAVLGYRRALEQDPGPAQRVRILERLAAWQEGQPDDP